MRYTYQVELLFDDGTTKMVRKLFSSLDQVFKQYEESKKHYDLLIDFRVYIDRI